MRENHPQMTQMSGDGGRAGGHLRKSASSADSRSLHPREIQVHIEELVLHGFDPRSRWSVADALESQLRGLLAERGLPSDWLASPERLMTTSKPGEGIAEAIHRGVSKP